LQEAELTAAYATLVSLFGAASLFDEESVVVAVSVFDSVFESTLGSVFVDGELPLPLPLP